MVPPTLLLTSCRAARPYLTYLPRDEPYLPISPTAYMHTASHRGKWERKLFICTTEFGSNSNNHGHDASVGTSRFLEALTSNNPPGHPESKTRYPGFKLSRGLHLTYLPTYLTKSHKGKQNFKSTKRNSSSSSFSLYQTTPLGDTTTLGQGSVASSQQPFCGHLIPSREQTTPIST